MDFPIDILELPGALATASWNGVPFYMPDSRHEIGRRVQRFFFPGRDDTEYQDFGAFDGPMRVTGLMVGDLYITYAQQMEDALRTPGPGTLVHPWFGDLNMVLVAPATVIFSQRELRVVRFEAVFAPVPIDAADLAPEDALSSVLDDIADVQSAVEDFLAPVLAPLGVATWIGATVEGWLSTLQGYWQSVTGATQGGIWQGTSGSGGGSSTPAAVTSPTPNPQLAAAVAAPIAALTTAGDLAAGTAFAQGVYNLVAAVPAAVVAAATPLQPSQVGPGDAASIPTPIAGTVAMALLLAANTQAQSGFTATDPVTPALSLAEAALTVAAAVAAATTIAWPSAQQAQASLGELLGAIDATAAQAAIAAVPTVSTIQAAVQAGQLWSQLEDLRAGLSAYMSATIGTLPQVQTVQAFAQLPAWVIANILAGDNPALILPCYQDLITRNGLKNPAQAGPGFLETLTPATVSTLVPGSA